MIITIDGPAGSGKTTLARALAKKYGLHHLQTGLLYRAAAYAAAADFFDELDPATFNCEKFMERCDINRITMIEYTVDNADQAHLLYGNEDITSRLNHQKLDDPASCISADGDVRSLLLPVQQAIARTYSLVAEGRDCGSVVFQDAECKIFLTAAVPVRALRVKHDPQRGIATKGLGEIEKDLQARDKRDSERPVAPLTIPKDALIIDSSTLTFQDVLAKAAEYINKKSRV